MDAGAEVQEDSIVQLEGVLQRFSYDVLREATSGFSEESTLGHGGFGVVYKAELKPGTQVAIKRMHQNETHSQGLKEFKSEVLILSQLSHRNLIKLQGWCEDVAKKEYMLVYDLLPNGSLDDVLFKPAERTDGLSWAQKFKILTGAADGLDYLHHGLNQQVIHRDIKLANILLDKEWNAKLGDFGISRMVDHQGRAPTTNMAGTSGYIAPEVYSECQFTDKTDVYAFGVVILEVACGRRVLPSRSHKMGLVQWVGSAHSKGDLLSIVDKRHTAYDTKEMKRVLKVGLLCTQLNCLDRPSMRRTVQMLAGDVKVPAIRAWKPTSRPLYTPPWLLAMMKTLRHKDAPSGSSSLNNLNLVEIDPEAGKEFTYEELKEATNGFSLVNLSRQGSYGRVYMGTIAGNLVEVVGFNSCPACNIRFEPEVEIMSRVRHRNVVSVLGYGISDNYDRLLVYEYVPNGTLEGALHGPGAPRMDWATRMNIALGTARGLVYLHDDKRIIHGNVKASNIHLNNQWDALVGSFGIWWEQIPPLDPEQRERKQKVNKIFQQFDVNGDGRLNRGEMAALVIAVNPRVLFLEEQISAILDEWFRTYGEYIHGDNGLSLDGLVRTYDDGAGDVDRDFDALGLELEDAEEEQEGDGETLCSGTRVNKGYVDPEYHRVGRQMLETDVYCFGVVLLELITGKQPWDNTQRESLVVSTIPAVTHALTSRNMDGLADPNLTDKYDRKEMLRMLAVASFCVSHSSAERPNMALVLKNLSTKVLGLDNALVPSGPVAPSAGPPLPVVLSAQAGQGLQISGQLTRRDGQVFYSLKFENNTQGPLDGFMIQFNKNYFGLASAGPLQVPLLAPGASASTLLPMVLFQNVAPGPANSVLQVAVKNNQQPVWYYTDKIPLQALFVEDGQMERSAFLETWKSLPDSHEVSKDLPNAIITNIYATLERLLKTNLFFIARRIQKDTNQEVLYLSGKVPPNVPFLVELTTVVGYSSVKCAVKTPSPEMAPLFFEAIETLLR